MRRFNSYGSIDTEEHYYAPRKELIEKAYTQLVGNNPRKGGYCYTVWAPRQTGKTWIMQQILFQIQKDPLFNVLKINLEILKDQEKISNILGIIARNIGEGLDRTFNQIENQDQFQEIFKKGVLDKPLILILDEFDAIIEEGINAIVSAFRNIYFHRLDEGDKPTEEKTYLLHGVALIGVRSVLGIGNQKGSPFNIQRSIHIPNLDFSEVKGMFHWYEKESGQKIEDDVIRRLYDETRGQPGLTCWLAELLTEGFEDYIVDKTRPISMKDFNFVYNASTSVLPNNNILNLISKAKKTHNQTLLLEMFKTGEKIEFTFDEPTINDLYLNGLIDKELDADGRYYLRFSCPLVQKRLFNSFSNIFFREMGRLTVPFARIDHVITDTTLDIPNLLKLYQTYISENKEWLFKGVPRRADLRIYEAVYHFNLFSYLDAFLKKEGGRVFPEFPTGNGKIDLIIDYSNKRYGIELKSFSTERDFKEALKKAAGYGKQLGFQEIYLVSFLEYIEPDIAQQYEVKTLDTDTGVSVIPVFIQTGK